MEKLGIILGSNELSKVLYAGMTALISSSLDQETIVFVTMDAVKAFLKENPELKVNELSSRLVKESNEDVMSYFRKAKKSGKVRVYACSYATKLFHLSKESYNDIVDDVVGITTFNIETEGGKVITIW
jgi:peroxiredoxin family protein